MEDARQILLQALDHAGIPLPPEAQSVNDLLSPSSLVSICLASLSFIHGFQPILPLPNSFSESSMSEQFRLCNDLASSIKGLGYGGDLTFQQFLYPSEEETHKLLRFLLDNMAKCSDSDRDGRKTRGFTASGAKSVNSLISSALALNLEDSSSIENRLKLVSMEEKEEFSTSTSLVVRDLVKDSLEETGLSHDVAVRTSLSPIMGPVDGAILTQESDVVLKHIIQDIGDEEKSVLASSDDLIENQLIGLEERLHNMSFENAKLTKEITDLERHLVDLEVESEASAKQLSLLKRDYYVLENAADIALDPSKDEESKVKELMNAIDDNRRQLGNLNTNWENTLKELQNEKSSLEASATSTREEIQMKLKRMKETHEKIEELTVMSKRGEAQLASLTMELEQSTKGPSRSSYIKRITELIKNSKKQDIDISQIIEEIRGLQRESNANQGRLKRTYALVDELVFRDAKREPLSRQAYRFLTSLHENFSECYDKVFLIDKIQKEISELQETIGSLEKSPIDLKKLQVDIDSIVAENLSLQKV